MEDDDLRGLQGMEIKLPYPVIALEYTVQNSKIDYDKNKDVASTRRIAVAATDPNGHISIMPIAWIDESKGWMPFNPLMIPKGTTTEGIKVAKHEFGLKGSGCWKIMPELPFDGGDYHSEVRAVVLFLNALACKNVVQEKAVVGREGSKSALPFDSYHILALTNRQSSKGRIGLQGAHRSPREHLRRGHIRRLANDERIWVNACVVNGGIGGKITKDYRLK